MFLARSLRARPRLWMPLLLLMAAGVALAGCAELRDVRRALEGPPEAAAPPEAQRKAPPAPARPGNTPSAPVAGVAALPGATPPVGSPLPGAAALPQLPDIRLTPPAGVVPLTRVAILLPLSGPEEKLGQALLNAAQLALFSLADNGFALMPVDTRGTPEGAAAAVRTALQDGAKLILGPVFAASVAAAAPMAREAGVQMVSFSNDRSVAGDGVYVMGFTPETQIGRITAYAAARGVTRIATIVPDGTYGDRVEESLRAATAAAGIDIAHVLRYASADTKTLSPLVRRLAQFEARRAVLHDRRRELEGKTDEASTRALKRLEGMDTLGEVDFDAVLMPEGGSALRALAPLLPFYDIDPRKVRMLGTKEWDDPSVVTEPSLFGGWFPAPPPEARAAFERIYQKAYNEPPARLASLAYDATALAVVLARARAESARVAATARPGAAVPVPVPVFTREALTSANGFSGVDGIFRPLPSGLVERGLAVMEVRSRRVVVVSPAPSTFQKINN